MNKKNYLWSMFTIMMVAMMSAVFVSCSKDDDNNNNNNSAGSIVGTWEISRVEGYEMDNDGQKINFNVTPNTEAWEEADVADYVQLEFRSDNTGTTYVYNKSKWVADNVWKYVYDTKTKILKVLDIDDEEDDEDYEEFKVLSVNASNLVLESTEEDEHGKSYYKGTYKKIK